MFLYIFEECYITWSNIPPTQIDFDLLESGELSIIDLSTSPPREIVLQGEYEPVPEALLTPEIFPYHKPPEALDEEP